MRVKRSMTFRFSPEPRNWVLSVKLVVSTTSVSPSHRPIESPSHFLMCAGGCVPPMRMKRDVVHHLVEDHDGVARLNDLLEVVVEVVRQRRRSRRRAEAEEAPLRERARFRAVVLAARTAGRAFRRVGADLARLEGRVALARFGLHRRHPAVDRIDDERRAFLAVHHERLDRRG